MENTEVPLTITSAPADGFPVKVIIGDQKYYPGAASVSNSYWFSVYDRSTLKQVFSALQVRDADTVPADLAGKYNTPDYFLVVATIALDSAYTPAGPLHAFLVDTGAGVQLKRVGQLFQQFGCGSIGTLSYAMAGVLGVGVPSHPNVEAATLTNDKIYAPVWLAATLIGVPVPSGMLYSPFPLTPPTP